MFKKIVEKYGSLKVDFFIFLFLHFLVWSCVPLFRQTLPMDSIEAIIWGQNGGWLTNKHPPLSGYVANIFYNIFFGYNISMYILSQICILIGFIYIYKLARLFISERRATLSVLLLEGVIYYGFTSIEFNVNILSLALWPATVYYYYKSLHDDKLCQWIILGLLIGLNILNKYTCVYLFFAMFVYLIVSRETRKNLLNKNLYLCGLIALLCIFPHLYWLYKTDFVVFEYFKSRSITNDNLGLLANLYYPVKFILSQILAGLATIMIFVITYWKSKKDEIFIEKDDKLFILCLCLLPILCAILPSIITGAKMKSMWGTPCLYMLTIILFSFFHFEMKDETYKKLKYSAYIFMIMFALISMFMTINTKSIRYYFPKDKFVKDMTNCWNTGTGESNLKYVAGDIWYTSHMSLFQKDRPQVVYNIDKKYKNILNDDELAKNGLMIIGSSYQEVKDFEKYFNVWAPINEYHFQTKNLLGQGKEYVLYFAIIPPTIVVK